MTAAIVPARLEDIPHIAPYVRPDDVRELWAIACLTAEDALVRSFGISDVSWTGLIDGKPVCMLGATVGSLLSNIGRPWMIGTEMLDRHQMAFLRRCRPKVQEMLSQYGRLENYVDERNVRAVNWLRWLGFTIEAPEPYGAFRLPFHRFWMEKQ